jgi:hypothetical protein
MEFNLFQQLSNRILIQIKSTVTAVLDFWTVPNKKT